MSEQRIKEIRDIIAEEVKTNAGVWTIKSAVLFDELCVIVKHSLAQERAVWNQIEKEYERDRIPHTTFRRLQQVLMAGDDARRPLHETVADCNCAGREIE